MMRWMLGVAMGAALPAWAAAQAGTVPAETPQVFAPGAVSASADEDSAAFAADGRSVYFDRLNWPNGAIMVSRREASGWSTPRIAPFSGHWLDHDPAMAPDGSFLVFTSNRPDAGDTPLAAVFPNGKASPGNGGHLWRVDRKGDGWGTPWRLPDPVNASSRTYAPSVAADGSVYFQRPDPKTGDFRIYRTQYRDGRYLPPQAVMLGDDPAAHQLDPAVAPDESFIVFDANFADHDKADRLYIAFREGDHWGRPIDMGDALNRFEPWGSHLGPDARTLYFTSNRGQRVHYPRDDAQAAADLARMQAWDNGRGNIWKVSLEPWLRRGETARTASPTKS